MSAKSDAKLDGPSVASVHNTNVSLRDYLAGQALAGMLASGEWYDTATHGEAASECYSYADALLRAGEVHDAQPD